MRIFRLQRELRKHISEQKSSGKTIGFVPTMGALHAGHLSLIGLSKQKTDVTVCSVFVNPTQFNDPKDLEKYPRNEAADTAMLESAGCDVLYLPDVKDIYPNGVNALVDYDLSPLDSVLEGASRPGHYKGVANVVKNLLDAVEPDVLVLGQKDFQQVAVIKRLIALVGMNVNVITAETKREANGLAMSSRNERLDSKHRSEAAKIYKALQLVQTSYGKTPHSTGSAQAWPQAREEAVQIVNTIPDSSLDYLELRDADTLEKLEDWNDSTKAVCLIAISVNGVRLIDNVLLNEN